MSRKIICLLLAVVMVISLSACGGASVAQDKAAETTEYYNYDLSGFIKLGDYKNLKVTIFDTKASEEDIDDMVKSYIEGDYFFKDVDRAAAMGDKVEIAFVGTIDGEAFENGSSDSAAITLGDSGYIDGFDEAIVGMNKGESKDAPLKFPDDYNNPNLQGKDAVFKITLKNVSEAVKGELTDEFLKEYSDMFNSVEELREYCKKTIEDRKTSSEENQNKNGILKAIEEVSEFLGDLPKADFERNLTSASTYYQNLFTQYLMYGMFDGPIDEFLKTITGEEVDDVDAFYEKMATEQEKNELILAAVAKAEKIAVSDDEYKDFIANYEKYGAESEEDFVEQSGGKEYIMWYILYEKVLDTLVNTVTFVDADGNKVDYPVATPVPETTEDTSK